LLDLFFLDDHVAVLLVLEAFDDLAARDGFVFGLAIEDLFDTRSVVFVKLVEADAFAARGAVQAHGEGDESECQMTFPDCGCHGVETSSAGGAVSWYRRHSDEDLFEAG